MPELPDQVHDPERVAVGCEDMEGRQGTRRMAKIAFEAIVDPLAVQPRAGLAKGLAGRGTREMGRERAAAHLGLVETPVDRAVEEMIDADRGEILDESLEG